MISPGRLPNLHNQYGFIRFSTLPELYFFIGKLMAIEIPRNCLRSMRSKKQLQCKQIKKTTARWYAVPPLSRHTRWNQRCANVKPKMLTLKLKLKPNIANKTAMQKTHCKKTKQLCGANKTTRRYAALLCLPTPAQTSPGPFQNNASEVEAKTKAEANPMPLQKNCIANKSCNAKKTALQKKLRCKKNCTVVRGTSSVSPDLPRLAPAPLKSLRSWS